MSNSKVEATFHGADRICISDIAPCGEPACVFCHPEDLTPEQDLRAAIAERLTDAIHFNHCPGDPNCNCLLGRIRWAIGAEELPAPDQTEAAIDTMARHIIGIRMWQDEFGSTAWNEIPEIGAHDFEAVTARIKAIITDSDPTTEEYDLAYAHLTSRVDGAA